MSWIRLTKFAQWMRARPWKKISCGMGTVLLVVAGVVVAVFTKGLATPLIAKAFMTKAATAAAAKAATATAATAAKAATAAATAAKAATAAEIALIGKLEAAAEAGFLIGGGIAGTVHVVSTPGPLNIKAGLLPAIGWGGLKGFAFSTLGAACGIGSVFISHNWGWNELLTHALVDGVPFGVYDAYVQYQTQGFGWAMFCSFGKGYLVGGAAGATSFYFSALCSNFSEVHHWGEAWSTLATVSAGALAGGIGAAATAQMLNKMSLYDVNSAALRGIGLGGGVGLGVHTQVVVAKDWVHDYLSVNGLHVTNAQHVPLQVLKDPWGNGFDLKFHQLQGTFTYADPKGVFDIKDSFEVHGVGGQDFTIRCNNAFTDTSFYGVEGTFKGLAHGDFPKDLKGLAHDHIRGGADHSGTMHSTPDGKLQVDVDAFCKAHGFLSSVKADVHLRATLGPAILSDGKLEQIHIVTYKALADKCISVRGELNPIFATQASTICDHVTTSESMASLQ